uniref:Uncharacterized protein n=1 Tax=Arundo donax TaxID=35708 RepID=A0A0A9FIE1_ARUDO
MSEVCCLYHKVYSSVSCASNVHLSSGIKYLFDVDEAFFACCLENSFRF